VRFLHQDKGPLRPKEEGGDILGSEFPYLGAIGALRIVHDMKVSIFLLETVSSQAIEIVKASRTSSDTCKGLKIFVYSIGGIKTYH
jgi:hypothetical protein